MSRPDVLIAGAGLCARLVAMRLKRSIPGLRVELVDRTDRLASRTWSFHDHDIGKADWVRELAPFAWAGYDVSFPAFTRTLSLGYRSLRSVDLDQAWKREQPAVIHSGREIAGVDVDGLILDDGSRLEADLVLDARGVALSGPRGYQKFLGLELELESRHSLDRPILMDAAMEQRDGFHFMYVLPFDPRTLLLEDTCYSEKPELDETALESRIRKYASARGWRIRSVVRRERGVLPIPLLAAARSPGLAIGMSGGLFHPVTGYSLPWAVRVADELASMGRWNPTAAAAAIARAGRELSARAGFHALLNRMLFQAAAPDLRYRVFERFYRLPESLIGRFYRSETTWLDRARLLSGRPPVPLSAALRCLGAPRDVCA